MEHLRQQNEWLDGELREKTNQLLTVRKEKVRISEDNYTFRIGQSLCLFWSDLNSFTYGCTR